MVRQNILLTGPPGCGKTTVIRRVVEGLGELRLAGFYTQELREHGRRVGFEAIGISGRREILAHVSVRSQRHVGRYGVDVASFEDFIEAELAIADKDVDVFVVDEIGKMECFSESFVDLATRTLDGPVAVLATIAMKGGGFMKEVKQRPDAELLTVSLANRDELPNKLRDRFLKSASGRG